MGRQPPRDIFLPYFENGCTVKIAYKMTLLGLRALEEEGKVASDDASIPDAMCGDERRFGTGVR